MSKAQTLDITLPKLHPTQQLVHDGRRRFTALRTGRQWGKSLLASVVAIEQAINTPDQFILILAPTFKQTEAIYGRIRRLLRPLINLEISGIEEPIVNEYKSEHRFNFFNGSTIMAATADNPDRLRGYSIHLAIIDEAAMLPNRDLWVEVIRPALAVTQGSCLFISTPKGKSNWFYSLWQDASADKTENGPNSPWALFHFKSVDSPYFPDSEAEDARALGENTYLQEYDAEFVATKNRLIGAEDFSFYTLSPQPDDVYYLFEGEIFRQSQLFRAMTVDLAVSKSTSADYTAFCVADITPRGTVYVRDVYRERILGPDLANRIIAHAKNWNVQIVYVEKAGFQLTVIQELQRKGLTIEPIPPKGDKVARATLLATRMRSHQFLYLRESPWFISTEDEVTSFDGAGGAAHDDRVDALSYMAEVSVNYSHRGGPTAALNITLNDLASATLQQEQHESQEDYFDRLRMAKQETINKAQNLRDQGRMGLEAMRGPR